MPLLGAYFVLATSLSLLNPLFESPDEIYHVGYIKYLRDHLALPVLKVGELSEYHQGPLYYTLAALATLGVPMDDYDALAARGNPFRSYRFWEPGVDNKNVFLHGPWDAPPYHDTTLAVHLARGLSVLLGLGTVALTYRLARRGLDFEPSAAAGAAALVAFNPVFLLITSSVHNDALTMPIGAALLVLCVDQVRRGPSARRELLIGALLGLDWLTKITTLFIAPAVGVALLLAAARAPQRLRTLLRGAILVGAVALALSGWTFVRNIALYGEPTGVNQDMLVWTHWTPPEAIRALVPELPFIWSTFWGRFGHGEVAMPDWVFTALAVACAPAVIGLVLALVRRGSAAKRAPMLVLLTATAGLVAAMAGYYLNVPDGHAARYTFPALSATACLLFAGWRELAGRAVRWAAVAVVAGLGLLASWAVFGIVPAAYARPLPAVVDPSAPATRFGDLAEVVALAAEPASGSLHAGDAVTVRITWRALRRADADYAVYVHLIDPDGIVVAQRDTYPGLGRYATTAWNPGFVWQDEYRVLIPEGAFAPDTFHVNFGLYKYATGERVPVTRVQPGLEPEGTVVYALAPPADATRPNATFVNFDDRLALLGYDIGPRVARPGEAITLTLVWESLAPSLDYYTVLAQVVGPGDAVYANGDGVPYRGKAPTPLWQPGHPLTDTHVLRLALDTPPGQYDVHLGWYQSTTLERLLIVEANRVRAHDIWLLSPVRVVPP